VSSIQQGKSVPPTSAAGAPPPNSEGPPAAPGRLDAFISYKRIPADIAFVDKLQPRLVVHDKHIWVDRAKIEPASDWRDRISRGIEAAKALIFVVTPESVSSEECRRELDLAVELHKLIIPVVIRGDFGNDVLPEQLSRPNWVDFRDEEDFETSLSKLVGALEGDLAWRDAHSRLIVRANEWAGSGQDRSFLLHGNDLRSAEGWAQASPQHPKTPPTSVQIEYIQASRKASDRAARTWRIALSVGLIVALGLGGLALSKEIQASHEARVAESNALSSEATVDLSSNPQESIALALRSTRLEADASTEQALRLALADARLRVVIRSGDGPAAVAAWSPTGDRIAVSAPGSIELWDPLSGRMLQALPVPSQYPVTQLLFDAGGSYLAAIASTGHVSLWRTRADGGAETMDTAGVNSILRQAVGGPKLSNLIEGAWDEWSAARSPSRWWPGGPEELVVYGPAVPNVLMVNPETGATRQLFNPGTQRAGFGFSQLAASPDGSKLFVDGQIIDFATATQSTLGHGYFNGPDSLVTGPACWYPDGSRIVTSTSVDAGGPADIWTANTGAYWGYIETPVGPTTAVGCSTGLANPWVAEGDAKGDLELFLPTGSVVPLYGDSAEISDISSSPDGRYMATSSNDGTARIWDARTGRLTALLNGGDAPLSEVQFDNNGGLVLTVDTQGLVRIWDTEVGMSLTQLQSPPHGEALALGFTNDGRSVYGVDISYEHRPRVGLSAVSSLLWQASSGRVVEDAPLAGIVPSAVPCSSALEQEGTFAEETLLSAAKGCNLPPPPNLTVSVPVPDPTSSQPTLQDEETLGLAMSQDGKYLAYGGARSITVLSLADERVAKLALVDQDTGLDFGPTGDILVITTDRAVYLWRPFSARKPLVVGQPSAPIDAELSQDGARLAVASAGGTVEVWDARNGTRIATFQPPRPPAGSLPAGPVRVALNGNGTVLASGDFDGAVYLWDVRAHREIAKRLVSSGGNWPVLEVVPASGGSRFLAVDYPQAGSGVNPSGSAEVLEASTGEEIAAYSSPGPIVTPVNPGAALSPNGSFLFAGTLGLAPSPPGGAEGVYQVSSGELMDGLAGVMPPGPVSYASSPAEPWSPSGNEVLIGNAIYACDACGSLHQMQVEAASRMAWSEPLSASDDDPPSSDPYS
jgi:WD40 repeat protein